MRVIQCGALGLHLAALLPASAQASVLQVFNRASVGSTTFDFGYFGPAGTGLRPSVFASDGPGTVGVASSSGTLCIDQEGADWLGNFADGDNLLAQGADDRSGTFIVCLTGKPVYCVGTQIQPGSGYYVTFTGNMDPFSATNALLGGVSVTGNSTNAADNSAPFIGAISVVSISNMEFNLSTGFPGFPTEGDLAINDLSLR